MATLEIEEYREDAEAAVSVSSEDDDERFMDDEELKNAFETCLDSIDSDGSFATYTHPSLLNPGLEVEGLGRFGMPLSEPEICRLINLSHQAPFGKGAETIVDTTVRNTWEIDASKIRLSHPQWPATQQNLLETVCGALGIANGAENVQAQLYKLLVYQPGAMFKPHKDTEKAPRMFGTLVISLPCEHEGGDLLVSFGGKTHRLKSSESSRWSGRAFAWYADVLHEITPVVSGYRVVLTYNLVHTGAAAAPALENLEEQHRTLTSTLSNWKSNMEHSDLPDRLIYLLEHKYTEENLRLDHLKGVDRKRVGALSKAAREEGFAVFLCNVEKSVSGAVEDGGYSHRYGRRRGYYDWDESDDEGHHDISEVFDEKLEMTKVVDLDGTQFVEGVAIEVDDIVQADPFEGRDVDSEDYQGWTGNAGAEATHWYRDGGLLIMPVEKVRTFTLENVGNITGVLQREMGKLLAEPANTEQRDFVAQIIQVGMGKLGRYLYGLRSVDVNVLLEASLAISRPGLFFDILDKHVTGKPDARTLGIVLSQIGQLDFVRLRAWLDKTVHTYDNLTERRSFLQGITNQCNQLSEETVRDLETWKKDSIRSWIIGRQNLKRQEIPDIISAVCEISNLNNVLSEKVIPLVRIQRTETTLVLLLITELRACIDSQQLHAEEALEALKEAVRLAALHLTLKEHRQPEPYARYHHYNPPTQYSVAQLTAPKAEDILKLAQILGDLDMQAEYPAFLEHLKDTCKNLQSASMESVMLPFLRDLLALFKQRMTDWAACAPLRRLYTDALSHYISVALGPQPATPKELEPRQIGCGCTLCRQLDQFLADPNAKTRSFQEYAKERRHLESRIQLIRTPSLIHCQAANMGRGPQGLQIIKRTGHWEFRDWISLRTAVRDKLGSVGSWEDLQQLLGDSFVDIMCMAKLVTRIRFPGRVPINLPRLAGPERTKAWIKECLVPDANAVVGQQGLWEMYMETMAAVPSQALPLSADDLCSLLPTIWAGAIVDNGDRKLVKGVRRWEKWKDATNTYQSPYASGSAETSRPPLASIPNTQPTPAVDDQTVAEAMMPANPLKRKIEIIDLCDSP